MKNIQLTQDKQTIVDDEDYSKLSCYRWQYSPTRTGYAKRTIRIGNKFSVINMARFITSCPKGKQVDHINHDTLDNRKENLRIVSQSQNMANRKINKNNKSGYKGVCWSYREKKWVARTADVYLGYFQNKKDAARAYNNTARKLYGASALLNII
jgi:hypothetical protein